MSPTRFGDPDPEPVEGEQAQHDPRCRKGWLPPFDADVAVPCLVCKPHLAPGHRVRGVGE